MWNYGHEIAWFEKLRMSERQFPRQPAFIHFVYMGSFRLIECEGILCQHWNMEIIQCIFYWTASCFCEPFKSHSSNKIQLLYFHCQYLQEKHNIQLWCKPFFQIDCVHTTYAYTIYHGWLWHCWKKGHLKRKTFTEKVNKLEVEWSNIGLNRSIRRLLFPPSRNET